MSEFDVLRKHEKTQHALVGLGRAALAAAVKNGHIRYPSYGGTQEEKRKRKKSAFVVTPLRDVMAPLPRYGSPNFPKGIKSVLNKKEKKKR